jgi:hypothetical protein
VELAASRRRLRIGTGARAPAPTLLGTPWQLSDVVTLIGSLTVGAVGLLVSWIGVSTRINWSGQIVWVAVGIGAVIVAGLGVMGFLLVAFRGVRMRRGEQDARLDGLLARHLPAEALAGESSVPATTLVSMPAMTRYHRPECLLVAGKPVHAAAAAAHARAGRVPCGVCRP